MKHRTKSGILLLVFTLLFISLSAAEFSLFEKMISYFNSAGYACRIYHDPDQIYPDYGRNTDWYSLTFDDISETVFVYFDESNRADFIGRFIEKDAYPCISRFGLRFLLCYSGDNESVLQVLSEIPNSTY